MNPNAEVDAYLVLSRTTPKKRGFQVQPRCSFILEPVWSVDLS